MPPRYATKASPASTSNYRRSKRISSRFNSVKQEQLVSLKEQPSTSKENPSKKRRLMETDEVIEYASQTEPDQKQDFSAAIKRILSELSPDLEITKEALVDMNAYLNHVYESLVRQSAILPLARNSVCITIKDIEAAVSFVIEGDLAKYCIAEGRRAVKQWNETEYVAAYK